MDCLKCQWSCTVVYIMYDTLQGENIVTFSEVHPWKLEQLCVLFHSGEPWLCEIHSCILSLQISLKIITTLSKMRGPRRPVLADYSALKCLKYSWHGLVSSMYCIAENNHVFLHPLIIWRRIQYIAQAQIWIHSLLKIYLADDVLCSWSTLYLYFTLCNGICWMIWGLSSPCICTFRILTRLLMQNHSSAASAAWLSCITLCKQQVSI